MKDIYFEPNYGKVYEQLGGEISHTFIYSDEYGEIRNMFLIRDIPDGIFNGIQYKDITTPYGYGGPIVNNFVEGNKDKLIDNYMNAFREYCLSNHIVSEFIRFHPIIGNAKDFVDVYSIEYLRKTVGTDLKSFDDPFQEECSKSVRKNVRKALKNGVTYQYIESPNNMDNFKEIYYSTMKRNHASDFYFFSQDYFDSLIKYFSKNILLIKAIYENKTIAMGLYFTYGEFIHTHLSGTLSEYLYLSPAYVLRYALIQWGKEHGYSLIHHGGGTSNEENDSLLDFKKRFTKETFFDYYVGKKNWQPEIFKELCKRTGTTNTNDFFPEYRSAKV